MGKNEELRVVAFGDGSGVPPGDVRNCLVGLIGRKKQAEAFNYRFEGGDLSDHSVGNIIIIAALADMTGSFCEGVDREEVEALNVRLQEANLLSVNAEAGVRHDPARFAEEVCEAALVRF
jgi:2-phospho-L-lactate transferase/gluconeogenesis factor (CofD/UPF0052 family)